MIVTTFITRCGGNKSNGPRITPSEGRTKEGEKFIAIKDSTEGINETDVNTKEKNMKEESSENQKHFERLLVTAQEAPAYNLEVLFINHTMFMKIVIIL